MNYGVLLINLQFIKLTKVTKLGQHLTSAIALADIKAYPGLQRSDDLNPVYVSIWSTFAECRPESPVPYIHTLSCAHFGKL